MGCGGGAVMGVGKGSGGERRRCDGDKLKILPLYAGIKSAF